VGDKTPAVLLHENDVILTVKTSKRPYVPEPGRLQMRKLSERFARIDITFGFMDEPNVSKALTFCKRAGFQSEIMQTSFYLGRGTLISDPRACPATRAANRVVKSVNR
jgi:KUP system potassium uptake protein